MNQFYVKFVSYKEHIPSLGNTKFLICSNFQGFSGFQRGYFSHDTGKYYEVAILRFTAF